MSSEISWNVEFTIKPGALEKFRMLTDEMIAAAQSESETLIFERFISEDGKVGHVLERYSNSEAAEVHLEAFKRKFAGRYVDLVERKRFTVFGSPSPLLRKLLDGFGATEYLDYLSGFSR